MRVVICNCFETNENRIQVVHDFFANQGAEVVVVQSDFKHISKVHRQDKKKSHIFIKSLPYYKNLSLNRLISHYKYSKDAMKIVEKQSPDLLYVIFPPNSLAKFSAKYRKKNKNVKLIFDIMDLWPETMPIGKMKRIPPFSFWQYMRDKNLKFADLILTECDLYQTVLKKPLEKLNVKTLHLAKKEINVVRRPKLSNDEINLAYLGSINNIIDIQKIQRIIEEIVKIKPVKFHILGDGESREDLIEASKISGAKVMYYGKVYDNQRKQDIFDQCHFGLNIMKDSVCVGLTMKSIDYFQHGLPIINNIPADTEEIVDKYNIGINVISDFSNLSKVLNESKDADILNMRNRTLDVFEKHFSVTSFNKKLSSYLRR